MLPQHGINFGIFAFYLHYENQTQVTRCNSITMSKTSWPVDNLDTVLIHDHLWPRDLLQFWAYLDTRSEVPYIITTNRPTQNWNCSATDSTVKFSKPITSLWIIKISLLVWPANHYVLVPINFGTSSWVTVTKLNRFRIPVPGTIDSTISGGSWLEKLGVLQIRILQTNLKVVRINKLLPWKEQFISVFLAVYRCIFRKFFSAFTCLLKQIYYTNEFYSTSKRPYNSGSTVGWIEMSKNFIF